MDLWVAELTHFVDLLVYCAILGGCVAAACMRPIAGAIDRLLLGWAALLRARGLFRIADLPSEQRRLDLLRIACATLAGAQFARNLASGAAGGLDGTPLAMEAQSVGLLLAALALAGIAAPLVTLMLAVLLNVIVDGLSNSPSLGSMVLSMSLVALALAPVGRSYSTDALLMRRGGPLGRLVRSMYAVWGPLTVQRAALIRSLAFLLYGLVALHSGLSHLRDDGWTSGSMTAWLLAAPTTNSLAAGLADGLYRAAPPAYSLLTRCATYLMLAWYVGLIPLVLLGRPTRWWAIAWGGGFFAFSIVVLPLRTLGAYELLLWVLLFWDRPFWSRPGLGLPHGQVAGRRHARHADEEARAAAAASGSVGARVGTADSFTLAFRAVMLSAVLLASTYALSLPAVAGVAAFDSLARVSGAVVGRATLAYGLGAVNVFNKEDLLTNRFSLQAWWGDGTERVAGFAEITPYLSATEQHTLTALQQRRAAHGRYCDEPFVRDYFAPLGWRHAEPILRDALDRPLYLHTVFTYVQWPTAADLAAFRYVPVEARPVCEVVVDAETAEPFLTVYSEYGTDLMNGGVELPFQARADVMPLLGRFPCSAEARRARHWLEQLEDGRPRDAALLATLDAAMDAPHTLSPAECVALVEAAGASRDLDWRASNLPPADQPCDADLGVANEIYARVLTGSRRDAVLPYVNGAVVAHARGDQGACLLAASEVRRTYRRDLGIAGLTTEAPPLLPGSGLPFRVRRDTVPVLERFPCEAEARRVAWWVARPGVEASGRTSSELLASLGRAGATDPLDCLDRVESAVAVYGLDWLRADSPPPTASCDADLALATFYVDTVLDDRQREVARAALTNAVAAHERGSGTECMLAAASVRQEFLVDVGARAPSRASSESMVRVANVPFPVRRDAAPLLARFPCMAEAQRIAWWADRPDRPERASVMQAVDPILRGADGVDASACLGTIRSVLESLDLDWRVDHAPPAWAACDADIALAAAYVDTAFDRTLGTTAKRHFSVALTAMQQGDNALCLRATAAVRRLYWQRIGAPIVREGATARRP